MQHKKNRSASLVAPAYRYDEAQNLTEEEYQIVYQFVDSVPISRTKRNLNRDFADASLMAEVIRHYFP